LSAAIAAELPLLLPFLLRPGDWFLKFFLELLLAEGDGFLPVGVVSGQVEKLPDGFRLDSPYPMDKGITRGAILERCDDLVVRRVGELSTTLGEAVYVVTETFTLLLRAVAKFVGVVGPGVDAL
jgi:hypothetical protein